MAPRKNRIRSCRIMICHWTADPRDVAGVNHSISHTSHPSEVGRRAMRLDSEATRESVMYSRNSCALVYRAHQLGSFAMQLSHEDGGSGRGGVCGYMREAMIVMEFADWQSRQNPFCRKLSEPITSFISRKAAVYLLRIDRHNHLTTESATDQAEAGGSAALRGLNRARQWTCRETA